MLSIVLSAQSNEGTEFWFAFMEHIDGRDADHVIMITSRTNTTGTINIEGLEYSRSFTVTANQVEIINIPSSAQFIGSEDIRNLGIQITTALPVSVYIHQYHNFRSEAALVLPISSLSDQYYVMSNFGISGDFGEGLSQFCIVAYEDETEVDILLSATTKKGVPRNTTISQSLNKGEVYQVQATNSLADITGTFVSGNKNFAILAGCSWSQVPLGCRYYDNLLEMMTPMDTWGKEFVAVPTLEGRESDIFRILSSQDNNQVEIINSQGNLISSFALHRGEYQELESTNALYIKGSHPVIIAQYMKGSQCQSHINGDPSMLILNSLEQIRDTVIIFNSNLQNITENYISIISKNSDKESVQLDGNIITNWKTIGEFSYSISEVRSGTHTITNAGCGVIASAYGMGDKESYAYGGGASFSKINASPLPEGQCVNIPVTFDSELPETRYDITWDLGPDIGVFQDHTFEYTYDEIGIYPAVATIYDKCFDQTEIIESDIIISLRQNVDVSDNSAYCLGDSIYLQAIDSGIDIPAGGALTYHWTGPDNFSISQVDPDVEIANSTISMSGQYKVIAEVSGCETEPAYTDVDIRDFPKPNLGADTILCSKIEEINIQIDPGEYDTYLWQDNSSSRILTITEEGEYNVVVTDDIGCEGGDAIVVNDRCPTRFYLPNIFTPNSYNNNSFGIYADDIIDATMSIYDKWGNLVFVTSDSSNAWQGNYNNQDAIQGIYTYLIDFQGYDDEGNIIIGRHHGTVLLVR